MKKQPQRRNNALETSSSLSYKNTDNISGAKKKEDLDKAKVQTSNKSSKQIKITSTKKAAQSIPVKEEEKLEEIKPIFVEAEPCNPQTQKPDEIDNRDKNSKKEKSKKFKKDPANAKPKKKFNTRSLVSMLVLFVLGVSSGIFTGKWYAANFIAGPATDYSQFTEISLREGNDAIALEYANKKPTANSAWKSYVAAEKNLLSAESFDILGNGLVDTIVKQHVYSRKTYNGETIVVEQISDGMVAVADKFVYKPANYNLADATTHILRTKGKLNGKKTIDEYLNCDFDCKHGNRKAYCYNTNYNGKQSYMTEPEYIEAMGGMPVSATAYIISEKTVLSCKNFRVVGSGADARYCFSLNLHSGASVLNYVKQMKTVSGLSDYPSFTQVNLDIALVMIDGLVMIDTIDVYEKYSVKYGTLTPKCTGTLHQRFLYNGDYTISE